MSVEGERGAKDLGAWGGSSVGEASPRPRRWTRAWGWSALLAWGCGGSTPPPAHEPSPEPAPAEAEEKPFDAQTLFSREAEAIARQGVRALGDGWRAQVEAKSAPTVEIEEGGVQKISIELGWEQPLICRVYPGPLDVGQTLSQTLANVSRVAQVQSVLGYGVENAGLEPIVFVRAVYEVDSEGGEKGAGDLKILLAPNAAGSVFCLHDALGYARSFQRVGGDFVRSFAFASPPPAPRRGELWVQTIDGLPVGFTSKKEFNQEGKGALLTSVASKFIPVSQEALATSDTADVVQLDAQGEVGEGNWIAFQEGREEYAVKLERKGKSYAVTGRVRGAAVDEKFTPRAPIWSEASLTKRFQKIAKAGKAASFQSEEYLPGIDASHATEVSYEVKPREGGFAIQALVKGQGMVLLADERGVPRAFQIPLPGTEVRGILLAEHGEP